MCNVFEHTFNVRLQSKQSNWTEHAHMANNYIQCHFVGFDLKGEALMDCVCFHIKREALASGPLHINGVCWTCD